MGTIVVFENVSLDGVTQDPTADEGLNREDWRAGLAPTDRWARRFCCWADAATSFSQHGIHTAPARWRTG
jgi:hypothetical protein